MHGRVSTLKDRRPRNIIREFEPNEPNHTYQDHRGFGEVDISRAQKRKARGVTLMRDKEVTWIETSRVTSSARTSEAIAEV